MYLCKEIIACSGGLSALEEILAQKIEKLDGFEIYKLAIKTIIDTFTIKNMMTPDLKKESISRVFPFLSDIGFSSEEIIQSIESYNVPLG